MEKESSGSEEAPEKSIESTSQHYQADQKAASPVNEIQP